MVNRSRQFIHLGNYAKLYRLAKKRKQSPEDYFAFQHFQDDLLVEYLARKGVQVAERNVLDLGSGLGGYGSALRSASGRVTWLDQFSLEASKKVDFVCSDALQIPFPEWHFDFVLCASLIEHLPATTELLREISRILRPDGIAYISFPPFYSPFGGHQFSPFHLLGERVAILISKIRKPFRGNEWLEDRYPTVPASFSNAFGDWGLYPTTIKKVERLIKKIPFEIIDRSTRWSPIDFSRVPLLGEFLTWHVQFLVRKT